MIKGIHLGLVLSLSTTLVACGGGSSDNKSRHSSSSASSQLPTSTALSSLPAVISSMAANLSSDPASSLSDASLSSDTASSLQFSSFNTSSDLSSAAAISSEAPPLGPVASSLASSEASSAVSAALSSSDSSSVSISSAISSAPTSAISSLAFSEASSQALSSLSSSSLSSVSSSAFSSSSQSALTGVFVDNVVAGIAYRTATQQGITNALGEYNYLPGEIVIFSVGSLDLPPVPARGVITPATIAEAAHAGDSTATLTTSVNILQLLQTLDQDGNPSNGIQITENTSALFTGVSLPDITRASFDTDITAFLPSGKTLVSETTAQDHFATTLQSQLLGSWVYSEGAGKRNVLSFIDATRYLIIHEHSDGESQTSGSVEYGNYRWSPEEKQLIVTLIDQSDADGGLWSEANAVDGEVLHTLALDANQLILGTPTDGQVVFERILDSQNPRIGAWVNYEAADDNLNLLTFLSSSEYVIAHTNNQSFYTGETALALSGEFGTYSLTNNNLQVLSASVDSDGDGGLYNRENSADQFNEILSLTEWGDLVFNDNDEGAFYFSGVGNFAANLQDMGPGTPLGTIAVTRQINGFTAAGIVGKKFVSEFILADKSTSEFIFTFDTAVNSEGVGSGTLVVSEESNNFDMNWKVLSSGALSVWLQDGEVITITIAKVNGRDTRDTSGVLLSIKSTEENSLFETRFNHLVD